MSSEDDRYQLRYLDNEQHSGTDPDYADTIDHNVEVFKTLPDSSLVAWLTRGLSGGDFSPLELEAEPFAVDQLELLYKALDIYNQERLKQATTRAIAEWLPDARSTELLQELALLAVLIRASAAVSYIRLILQDSQQLWLESLEAQDYKKLVSDLVAAVQAFSASKEAQDLLLKLFYNRTYRQFAAQVLVGLCEGTPQSYPEHVSRFFAISANPEVDYDKGHTWEEFVRVVSLPSLAANLPKVSEEDLEPLLRTLCTEEWSPLRLQLPMGESRMGRRHWILSHRFDPDADAVGLPDEWCADAGILRMLYNVAMAGLTNGMKSGDYISGLMKRAQALGEAQRSKELVEVI